MFAQRNDIFLKLFTSVKYSVDLKTVVIREGWTTRSGGVSPVCCAANERFVNACNVWIDIVILIRRHTFVWINSFFSFDLVYRWQKETRLHTKLLILFHFCIHMIFKAATWWGASCLCCFRSTVCFFSQEINILFKEYNFLLFNRAAQPAVNSVQPVVEAIVQAFCRISSRTSILDVVHPRPLRSVESDS